MLEIIKQLFSLEDVAQQCEIFKHMEGGKPTVSELIDCVKYIQQFQVFPLHIPKSIEIVGTGGSWLSRINTSTLTCILLAKKLAWSHYSIIKNGGKSASGKCGSIDLLESLDYRFPENEAKVWQQVLANHLSFLSARAMYPIMAKVWPARKMYGKSTIFNLIGPLLAPAESELAFLGCSDKSLMETMVEAAFQLGRKHVIVVRGQDGLDEVTLTWPTDIVERSVSGIAHHTVNPSEFWYTEVPFLEISGWDPETNIHIAKNIIAWTCVTQHKNLIEINIRVVEKYFWQYLFEK